ncbi:restriction endonuclease subunit S [Pseudomonas oryzihabitans]|uniref:restriction endonuclease subunit S n=1 Tax=Pseudomonas oryzihabitans TaxID=47885 RepID=UPI0028641353|nr:restriction endonuclease subunit S [Pseudomonas psychrotolerans]MDR6678696.1 type I restriction enzyme S subunit [Pseudomonas psychrotolerans]
MSEWVNGILANAIASLNAGVSVNSEDRPHGAGEIGVLKTNAISGGVFRAEQNKTVIQHERGLVVEPVQADSILVSRMNTPALVGDSCYVPEEYPSLFLPDRLWQLKPKDRAQLNMRWLSFVLQSADYRRYVEVHATGTSGSMKNLPKSKLLALPVQYPATAEQTVIAQILNTLDTAIRKTEALIDKLKAVKQGLLHDLLTRGIDANGQLRPPQSEAPQLYKESPLGWISREWGVLSIGALLTDIEAGKSPSCPDIPAPSGSWGVLKVSAVHPDGFRSDQNKLVEREALVNPAYEIRSGDLLITRANTPELVGLACLVENPQPKLMLCDKTLRLLVNDAIASKEYLFLCLQQPYIRSQIENSATGTSMSMKNISQAAIRGLLVAAAPLQEQIEISSRANVLALKIQHEMAALEKLRQQKSGLMEDLLTGRVRVTPLLESMHQAATPTGA